MSTPSPPRLTGDVKSDLFAIVKYLGDFFRSLVVESQLPQARQRIAAVDVTAISAAGADAKVTSRTATQLPTFSNPPTPAEMAALQALVNGLSAVALKMVQAAQKQ